MTVNSKDQNKNKNCEFKILIANDEHFQIKMIEMILINKFDMNTTTALNGKIALDIFKQFIVNF